MGDQLGALQFQWLGREIFCHAAIDEAIEALHLSPALEVLHAAMAIAGDQTAQVTLLSRSHLRRRSTVPCKLAKWTQLGKSERFTIGMGQNPLFLFMVEGEEQVFWSFWYWPLPKSPALAALALQSNHLWASTLTLHATVLCNLPAKAAVPAPIPRDCWDLLHFALASTSHISWDLLNC